MLRTFIETGFLNIVMVCHVQLKTSSHEYFAKWSFSCSSGTLVFICSGGILFTSTRLVDCIKKNILYISGNNIFSLQYGVLRTIMSHVNLHMSIVVGCNEHARETTASNSYLSTKRNHPFLLVSPQRLGLSARKVLD